MSSRQGKEVPSWATFSSNTTTPYQDDCEEYVPLSPDQPRPNTFMSMLTTPWGGLSSESKLSTPIGLTAMQHASISSYHTSPSPTPILSPISSPYQPPTSTPKDGTQSTATQSKVIPSVPNIATPGAQSKVNPRAPNVVTQSTKTPSKVAPRPSTNPSQDPKEVPPSKKAKLSLISWSESATYTLLHHYNKVWKHIKKENLRAKDWKSITDKLNRDLSSSTSFDQVKNKFDTLKKTYKKEKPK